mmetsp:Transcript_30359/g.97092  ORF Transcript_30359/g.97092 Transcript_30359/m.97092 type:complete len:210 (-) Transcript_30359:110-739(-)
MPCLEAQLHTHRHLQLGCAFRVGLGDGGRAGGTAPLNLLASEHLHRRHCKLNPRHRQVQLRPDADLQAQPRHGSGCPCQHCVRRRPGTCAELRGQAERCKLGAACPCTGTRRQRHGTLKGQRRGAAKVDLEGAEASGRRSPPAVPAGSCEQLHGQAAREGPLQGILELEEPASVGLLVVPQACIVLRAVPARLHQHPCHNVPALCRKAS